MMFLMIVLGIAVVVVLVVLDVVAIRHDGYGTTPPPRSHERDSLTGATAGRLLF